MELLLRFAELRRVDRGICLDVGQLCGIPAVQPKEGDLEREFDSAEVTIIGVVDLRGNASDRRIGEADHPRQKSRLHVEVKRCKKASGAASLEHLVVLIADALGRADGASRSCRGALSSRILVGSAVESIQRDGGGGDVAGVMAGIASHHLRAGEVRLIDGGTISTILRAVFFTGGSRDPCPRRDDKTSSPSPGRPQKSDCTTRVLQSG
jgi:hypothetical protein